VCSHITSQRDAAETRLRDALKRSTLGTLTEQVAQKYALYGFQRGLEPRDVCLAVAPTTLIAQLLLLLLLLLFCDDID
jgi:hypothetical protein